MTRRVIITIAILVIVTGLITGYYSVVLNKDSNSSGGIFSADGQYRNLNIVEDSNIKYEKPPIPKEWTSDVVIAIYNDLILPKDIGINVSSYEDRIYGRILWKSEDGYSIHNKDSGYFSIHRKLDLNYNPYEVYKADYLIEDVKLSAFMNNIRDSLRIAGFVKDELNSSIGLGGSDYSSYNSEGYIKGDTICLLRDSGSGSVSFGCADNFTKNYAVQKPLLDVVGLDKDSVAVIEKQIEDYLRVIVNYRFDGGGGHTSFVKQIGDSYELILNTQEVPDCYKFDEYKVPKELYGVCYDGEKIRE